MSDGKNVLSLLGLALRGGRLAVGDEAAGLSARGGRARLLLVASDAGERTIRQAQFLAEEGHCLLLKLPFAKAELGGALGRKAVSIAAVTDLGLAAAVTEKLALLDPEGCGGAAERMQVKLRRAKERKEAPRKRPPPEDASRRPGGKRPGEGRPGGRKPYGGKPGRGRPDGGKPYSGRPRNSGPNGGKPKGRKGSSGPKGGPGGGR